MGTPRFFGLKNQTEFLKRISAACHWTLRSSSTAIWRLSSSQPVLPVSLISCLALKKIRKSLPYLFLNFFGRVSTKRTDWRIRVDLHTQRQGKKTIAEYILAFKSLANQWNYRDEALLTAYFLGLNTPVQIYLESLQTMHRTFNNIVATYLITAHHKFSPITSCTTSWCSFSTNGNC